MLRQLAVRGMQSRGICSGRALLRQNTPSKVVLQPPVIEATAAEVVKTIGREGTVVLSEPSAVPGLAGALLEGGAREVIAVGSKPKGIPDSSACTFLEGDLHRLDMINGCPSSTELLGHLKRRPWKAHQHSIALFNTYLKDRDRGKLISWAFQIGARAGAYQWGRLSSFFLVPESIATAMTAAEPGNEGLKRITVLFQSVAEITALGPVSLASPKKCFKLNLLLVKPFAHPMICDVRWLDYTVRRVMSRRGPLEENARMLAPAADQLIKAAKLDPKLPSKSMTVEDHIALATALSKHKHRPDIELM